MGGGGQLGGKQTKQVSSLSQPHYGMGNIMIRPSEGGHNHPMNIDIPPADLGDPFAGEPGFGLGSRFGNPFVSSLSTFPPANTPGFAQGPTLLPTTFDAQGYPNAISASISGIGNPDWWRYF